ncbi:MAG: hypothetical protein SFY32_11670 [Bacteroidota bacterium]|nr:hypothetical protein [Bacteroidota bacterium]
MANKIIQVDKDIKIFEDIANDRKFRPLFFDTYQDYYFTISDDKTKQIFVKTILYLSDFTITQLIDVLLKDTIPHFDEILKKTPDKNQLIEFLIKSLSINLNEEIESRHKYSNNKYSRQGYKDLLTLPLGDDTSIIYFWRFKSIFHSNEEGITWFENYESFIQRLHDFEDYLIGGLQLPFVQYLKEAKTNLSIEKKLDKLKVPQIALIHIYEDKQITEENANEIAANYGYTAKTSGKGLYHDYLKYCKTSDRKAKPTAETKKTLINKIELFKSIVNYLSEKAKQKANDEINILKTILENEYP